MNSRCVVYGMHHDRQKLILSEFSYREPGWPAWAPSSSALRPLLRPLCVPLTPHMGISHTNRDSTCLNGPVKARVAQYQYAQRVVDASSYVHAGPLIRLLQAWKEAVAKCIRLLYPYPYPRNGYRYCDDVIICELVYFLLQMPSSAAQMVHDQQQCAECGANLG